MSQPDLFSQPTEPKPGTQKAKILNILIEAKQKGFIPRVGVHLVQGVPRGSVSAAVLVKTALQYGARMFELREDGFNVSDAYMGSYTNTFGEKVSIGCYRLEES